MFHECLAPVTFFKLNSPVTARSSDFREGSSVFESRRDHDTCAFSLFSLRESRAEDPDENGVRGQKRWIRKISARKGEIAAHSGRALNWNVSMQGRSKRTSEENRCWRSRKEEISTAAAAARSA